MHVKNIHCMIEELADGLKSNVTKNMKADEVKVLGETVDMLKDLCTAEYYARIAKAMEESEKEDEEEAKYMMKQMKEQYSEEDGEHMYRMGYNRNRYSNGRFAPRGRGRRMGYMPTEMRMPYLEDEYMAEYLGYPDYMDDVKMRMGYNSGGRGSNSGMGMRGGDMNNGNMDGNGGNDGNQGRSGYGDGRGESEGSRYGRSYDSYRENRRHFTETKSEESKKHMENSMKEYTNDVMENIREMWRDADPTLRKSMKEDLTKMVQQLQ